MADGADAHDLHDPWPVPGQGTNDKITSDFRIKIAEKGLQIIRELGALPDAEHAFGSHNPDAESRIPVPAGEAAPDPEGRPGHRVLACTGARLAGEKAQWADSQEAAEKESAHREGT